MPFKCNNPGCCKPCDAEFSYTVNGCVVDFLDESTGSIASWLWDFGDGNTSTEQNPQHTYDPLDGPQVTVRLTITTSAGQCETADLINICLAPCDSCPEGELPETIYVTISGNLAGDCGDCAAAIGTFALTRLFPDNPLNCSFQYVDPVQSCCYLPPPRGRFAINIGIDGGNPSFPFNTLVTCSFGGPNDSGFPECSFIQWGGSTFNVGTPNCRGTFDLPIEEFTPTTNTGCTGAITSVSVTI